MADLAGFVYLALAAVGPRLRGRAGRDPVARTGSVPRDRRLHRGAPAREGRLAAAPLAGRRDRRDRGGGSAHRNRDRPAAERVRRRQHLDPELDRPDPADVVPGHLRRRAGPRPPGDDRPRPYGDPDRPLPRRALARGARDPRARRARSARAGARARRRARPRRGRPRPRSAGRTRPARGLRRVRDDRRPGGSPRGRARTGRRSVLVRAGALVRALRRGHPRRRAPPAGPGRRARRDLGLQAPGRGDRGPARTAARAGSRRCSRATACCSCSASEARGCCRRHASGGAAGSRRGTRREPPPREARWPPSSTRSRCKRAASRNVSAVLLPSMPSTSTSSPGKSTP